MSSFKGSKKTGGPIALKVHSIAACRDNVGLEIVPDRCTLNVEDVVRALGPQSLRGHLKYMPEQFKARRELIEEQASENINLARGDFEFVE